MGAYQHVVSSLTLVPGSKGVFDVDVTRTDGTGERIYAKHDTGRQAEPGEVLAAFESMLPDGTLRYGT